MVKDSCPMGEAKISFANGAILSAKNIFLKNPKAISDIPNFKFLF